MAHKNQDQIHPGGLMRLNRQLFFLNHRRIRAVMDYLEAHLDDELVTLDTLAEVACLSRYHFERLYAAKVLETPFATLRRLRLMRARDHLQNGWPDSLTQLALQSGYGSVAAFSRAYSRAYGVAPSLVVPRKIVAAPAALQIVELPDRRAACLPYYGQRRNLFEAGNELSWRVAASGAQRWRHWLIFSDGCCSLEGAPDGWVRVLHCVPQETLPATISGADLGWLPGGVYARFEFVGAAPSGIGKLAARIRDETGWQLADGPVLTNAPRIHSYTPPSERLIHLYLPLARQ